MSPRSAHPDLLCNLVLIGGRGCGKSSIAKRIARQNRNFMLFSLDALIRYEAGGITIPELVEREGWPGFREREARVAEKLARFEREALLDCGGGIVVELDRRGEETYSERKVELIRRHGLVVYLRRDAEYLLDRIGGDPNRPELSETHSFLELMARRDPWYQRAADLVLDCKGSEKSELAVRVLEWFYETQSDRAVARPAGGAAR